MTDEMAATNEPEITSTSEPQVAESAPASKEPAAPPKEDGFSRRIDELTKNWRETERKADEASRDAQYWREQALRAQPPKEQPREAEQQVKTLADFEYDDSKYQSYLFAEAEKRATRAAEKTLKQQQDNDAKESRKAKFIQRESEFTKTAADYREKTRSPSFPVSDAMAEVFAESEEGPAVAYYLANNLSLADSISRMQPLAAARELGRIEAKLSFEREKAAKKVSEAPPPPPKIEGTDPSPTKPWNDPALSQEEFNKRRRQQIAKRR